MVGITFEVIDFLILLFFVFIKMSRNNLKTGYFVPLLVITVLYTIILNTMNFVGIAIMPNAFFMLIHLVVLFVYCSVSVPMYLMGLR